MRRSPSRAISALISNNKGELDYQLRVKTLSPWLALVDRQGSGSVNLTGGAKGNLNDLKTQGKITLSGIDFEGTAVQGGSIDYDLGYSSARTLPYGTLNISLSDIRQRVSTAKPGRSGKNSGANAGWL